MKKLIFIVIPTLIMTMAGFTFFPGEEEAVKVDEAIVNNITQETKKEINQAHEELNLLVGWKGSKNFSFAKKENKLYTLSDQLRDMKESISENNPVKNDISNAMKAVEKAIAEQDVKGLIVAHRILHDLDGVLNNDPLDGKVWGYTETVSGNNKKAIKYIQ